MSRRVVFGDHVVQVKTPAGWVSLPCVWAASQSRSRRQARGGTADLGPVVGGSAPSV